MAETLDVALVQLNTPADHASAWAQVEPLVREAAAGGAKLVLTPEGTNILEQRRDRRLAVIQDQDADPVVNGLRALAAELGIWLLIGSAIVKTGDPADPRAANRSILVGPDGTVKATYDKLHVFDVDLPTGERHRESESIRPGAQATVAETPWGGLGLSICYDVRFPHLYRALARAGASMIAVPAAFTRPTGEAHWEVMLRARAIETGAFVLAPAQGGEHEDGRKTWGRSVVISPWGEVLARAEGDAPGVLRATLDFSLVDKARRAIPQLTHDREFVGP
ncbi:carbon-nitrogen hydrolase family protein [Caulobacter sp. 17J80-11]|uniref:carbon-nitrogen hydrolase family protein n=1 Tax=Caulobacter sp. 17J80-11 TaxID=2763502 RepID=UPI001653C66F|nr:carbon-nitrogen hydrolase family protein [Caulobacter sp. 17J80-11]MBC6982384.1 carbon-nitrogen hydrolase family protein [Caulobacter sp. 17J80-11]